MPAGTIGITTALALDAHMQRRDAGCHVVVVHMAKAAALHHGLQLLLAGVHADRLGEVAVALGIARHHLPNTWQHLEGIQVVGLL